MPEIYKMHEFNEIADSYNFVVRLNVNISDKISRADYRSKSLAKINNALMTIQLPATPYYRQWMAPLVALFALSFDDYLLIDVIGF